MLLSTASLPLYAVLLGPISGPGPLQEGPGIVPAPQEASSQVTAESGIDIPLPGAEPQEGDEIDPVGGEILGRAIPGARLSPGAFGPIVIEDMAAVMKREAEIEHSTVNTRTRNGRQGEWQIPSRKIKSYPHTGEKCLINRWGDTSMGVGLGGVFDVEQVWVSSQGGRGIWAKEIRFVGYKDGEATGASEWFGDIDQVPSKMTIGLSGVDRIVVEAKASATGAGFYALDDLVLRDGSGKSQTLGFEDAEWDQRLLGSDYLGFQWEQGTGSFEPPTPKIVPAPESSDADSGDPTDQGRSAAAQVQAQGPTAIGSSGTTNTARALGGSGTSPVLLQSFTGPRLGDAGANLVPPDTCGAVGLDYFCAIVNSNLSIYEKDTGNRVVNTSLRNFFTGSAGTVGDPRIAYDFTDNRWVAIATNFGESCYFAYSLTSDPTGTWLKTTIDLVEGSDNGRWVDYPTLGVDSRGIFIEAFMVGSGARMTIFAIDKAPLLAGVPALGTVTAFRNLTWDGAIQHATQYTEAGASWMISTRTSTSLRLRRINEPLSSPTLSSFTVSGIPSFSNPPDAPALGSTVDINTGGTRLMNAAYAGGSIWAAHCVFSGGRAAARWYEIDPVTRTLVQSGTVTDPSLNYYFPSIAADAAGNVVMGFSGSDSSIFPSCYYTGREAGDPAGEMATPTLYSAGQNSYTITDGAGRNRWGDYSLTSLDPVDGTFWTIQERTRAAANSWITHIAHLEHDSCTSTITRYCTPVPNTTGQSGRMDTFGSTSISSNDLQLICSNLPVNQFGLFFYGQVQASSPLGDGTLCIDNPFFRLGPIVQASIFGVVSNDIDLSNPPLPAGQIMSGQTWNFSFWHRQTSPAGFNFSDALAISFCE